jgi:hypothetical protein
MRTCLTICWLVIGLAVPLAAQQNSVTGIRPLVFGIVFPGVPRAVPRTDAANSAQFDLRGRGGGRQVLLTFTLPTVMTGPAGATLPLAFGGNDAGFSVSQSVNNQVAFDPRTPHQPTLSNNGRGSVFLGGTANPSVGQRAGNYTGTITLTVVFF